MPGVDRKCVTHHACDCIAATARRARSLEATVDRVAAEMRNLHGPAREPTVQAWADELAHAAGPDPEPDGGNRR